MINFLPFFNRGIAAHLLPVYKKICIFFVYYYKKEMDISLYSFATTDCEKIKTKKTLREEEDHCGRYLEINSENTI